METFVDSSKKRKADENGAAYASEIASPLTPEDARKILDSLEHSAVLDILQSAVIRHSDVLDSVRSVADSDSTKRKLFVRGLGWETTTEKLKGIFSAFGEIEEAIVITDKVTGKSKGYGFVTFKHVDGAIVALRVPSKKIDGRMTVTQYASAGTSGGGGGGADVSLRKIYVGNVPFEISSERLLEFFSAFGEIEEGPLGFDKQTGKAKGFAFFVYRTEEGARNSLVEPMKTIDGHQVMCKLAVDGKKGKQGGPGDDRQGGQQQQQQQQPMPNSLNSGGYGGAPGGYGGFSGGPLGNQNPYMNNSIPSAVGGAGFGNQGPFGGAGGGYGAGFGSGGYGGSQYGGGASSEYGGPNSGGSGYRMPPTSVGMPSGGYPDSGNSGWPSSGGFPSQINPQSSGPRGPSGGMYQGMPPYY